MPPSARTAAFAVVVGVYAAAGLAALAIVAAVAPSGCIRSP